MILSSEFKLLDPLVTDLRIVNLVPFDNDEFWDSETSKELEKFFKDKGTMICSVFMTIQSTIFTETFEIREKAKAINIDVVKYTLKKDLLKKDYCSQDSEVGGKIKNLAKRAGLFVPEKAEKNEEKSKVNLKVEKQVKAEPRWKQLTLERFYQVNLKHFDSPDMFYIRVNDSSNKILEKLMKTVENCREREEMKEVKEGGMCMYVKDDKTHRAIITNELSFPNKQAKLLSARSISCLKIVPSSHLRL